VKNDVTVVNDVDVKLMSGDDADMKLMDDQKNAISSIIDNFRQQVSQIVDFEPGFTLTETQIRLDGVLTDQDIKFVLIAGEESGVYINADMLKLENEIGTMLEKLAKFDDTFKSAMEPLITQRDNN
jgi:BioD-like phosphotransacetylase family protein